jgi:preprotein translocase subunit Sec63
MGGMKILEEKFAVVGSNRNHADFKDLYEVLDLTASASGDEIKNVYKKLAV